MLSSVRNYMNFIWILVTLGVVFCQTALTPKSILVKKVNDLVTSFLTEPQISRTIDIIALDIHLNKRPEEIMNDLHDYLLSALSPEQLKTFNERILRRRSANVSDRIKKVVVYAVNPAVELVTYNCWHRFCSSINLFTNWALEVRANGETPELAYMTMSRQLTPDFVHGVISLVRDTLTPTEWKSVKQHFAPMLNHVCFGRRYC
ncbi:hypothetical protein COOONC_25839 [Cooperia oncophora]